MINSQYTYIDCHFHANIHGRSPRRRREIIRLIEENTRHVEIICSTEHAYKDPLGAYDALSEMANQADRRLSIIPGVEAISSEGIDIIFLFDSRHAMKNSIVLEPFSWSIYDFNSICDDHMISVLPHAFTPSKTGLITSMGMDYAREIMPYFDYIEISNGNYLDIMPFIPSFARTLGPLQSVTNTASFPKSVLPSGPGVCFGSDAHTPDGVHVYGCVQFDPTLRNFENLSQRLTMTKEVRFCSTVNRAKRIMSNTMISFFEYWAKKNSI